MADSLLDIRGLNVRFSTPTGDVHAVKGIDLQVNKGETLAIVGESGSGKSQTMMAIMGLLASNGRAEGSAKFQGQEMIGLPLGKLNRIRGAKITMIFQEPMTSLDPLYKIGKQLAEPMMQHRGLTAKAARIRAIELLKLVKIPDPERRVDSYPYEMSGGQRQRVMIAMALANDPELLIADEPTTALDVTIQAQILELLAELKQRIGLAIVFISHDLAIVRRFSDRVAVMRTGEVVETGTVADIFANPQHPYTKMLLAAEPTGRKAPPADNAPILLEGRDVDVRFSMGGGVSWAARSSTFMPSIMSTSASRKARRSASSAKAARANRRWGGRSCASTTERAPSASAWTTFPRRVARRCVVTAGRCSWSSRIRSDRSARA